MMIDLIWQQLMPHVIIGLQEASLIQESMAALELRLVFKFVVFTEGLFNMCRSLTIIITDSSHTRILGWHRDVEAKRTQWTWTQWTQWAQWTQ